MEKGGEHDPRLIDHIPKLIQKEYNAVAQKAFEGRTKSRRNSSKIWITDKFELRLRPKGDFTPWSKIPQIDCMQNQVETGTIPKTNSNPTGDQQQPRPKPDFSSSNNPNFQVLGKGSENNHYWEGPNLLPQQVSTSNDFEILGEELITRP